jgi:hypothetical protein
MALLACCIKRPSTLRGERLPDAITVSPNFRALRVASNVVLFEHTAPDERLYDPKAARRYFPGSWRFALDKHL